MITADISGPDHSYQVQSTDEPKNPFSPAGIVWKVKRAQKAGDIDLYHRLTSDEVYLCVMAMIDCGVNIRTPVETIKGKREGDIFIGARFRFNGTEIVRLCRPNLWLVDGRSTHNIRNSIKRLRG